MKLLSLFIIVGCLQVSAKSFSQQVTLTAQNSSLKFVFHEIEKQTGYLFLYDKQLLSSSKPISVSLNNTPLDEALRVCLKDQKLTFNIEEKTIVISASSNPSPQPNSSGTDVLFSSAPIRGKVLDSVGRPLSGATIFIKNDQILGVTDAEGVFNVNVTEGDVLFISYVGYETRSLVVTKSMFSSANNLVINLKAKVSELDDVEVTVNTGYQRIPKERATGSFAFVDNELLNRRVAPDILSRLQGITSGLQFKSSTEWYGDDQRGNIQIRSASTIFSNSSPLVVLDNFPFEGNIATINPDDVESVSVLKDAAATSIWGARASNGVIVITTKSGSYNRALKVSFNSNISFSNKPDLSYSPTLNSSDFVDFETFLFNQKYYDPFITSLSRPALSPTVEILLQRSNGTITAADSANRLNELKEFNIKNDLAKYYYDRPLQQQYNINLEGGGRADRYFISFGYTNSKNKLSDGNRFSINASNSYSMFKKKLELTTGLLFAKIQSNDFGSRYDFIYPYSRLADGNGQPLPIAIYRQGYIDTVGGGKLLDWSYYPLNEQDYANNKTDGTNYRLNAGLNYKVFQGLNIDIKYQYGLQQSNSHNLYSKQTFFTRDLINQFSQVNGSNVVRPIPLGSIFDQGRTTYTSHNARGQINYDKVFVGKHRISALAGAEISDELTNSNNNRSYGYDEQLGTVLPVDFVHTYPNYITGNYGLIPYGGSFGQLNRRFVSLFGNALYTYKGKYTISGSARKDGANIFGASSNNKWRPLWSTSLKWDISKEAFYHFTYLENLNLRASYGHQGNMNNSIAAVLTTFSYNSILNRWGQQMAYIQNYPNTNLRWENVGQYNIGVDFGSRHGVISGSIEYYRKKGIDLIGDQPLPPSSGVSLMKTNTADIKGEGIDFTLNANTKLGPIQWRGTFLFSYAKDWVSAYKATKTTIGSYVSGAVNPIVGKPVSALYSYKWAGLDPLTGDPQGYASDHSLSKDYVSLISSTNLDDMVYEGPRTAPYFGSLLNTFSWKGISLSANITYKYGNVFRRPSINYSNFINNSDRGNTDYVLRWQKQGDELRTSVPSFNYPADINRDLFYTQSQILTEKADLIRLQDVRIGYSINKINVERLLVQTVEIFVYASNLGLLWTANKYGIDPDYIPSNSYTFGLPGKSFAAGLKVDF